jgi:hypothetical protein
MHSSCQLKNFRDGKFIEYSRAQYLALFKPRERNKNLQTNIVFVDITNNTANAKIEIDTEKDRLT